MVVVYADKGNLFDHLLDLRRRKELPPMLVVVLDRRARVPGHVRVNRVTEEEHEADTDALGNLEEVTRALGVQLVARKPGLTQDEEANV